MIPPIYWQRLKMLLRRDPCGICCVFIAYTMIVYADYVVITFSIAMSDTLWAAFHCTIFNTLVVCIFVSHARAMCSDPGILPIPRTSRDPNELRNTTLDSGWSVCMKCEIKRPPRAHHCKICRRCVRKMDHHCPWVNNCVGECNQKHFIRFNGFVFASCVYGASVAIHFWLHFKLNELVMPTPDSFLVHTIIFSVECALFFFFTLAMVCDQVNGVFDDATLIEQKQMRRPQGQADVEAGLYGRRGQTRCQLLEEVFGAGPKILWLCPCDWHSNINYRRTAELRANSKSDQIV